MKDYSFFRLVDSFSGAKELGDNAKSDRRNYSFVQLLPNESYFQITNNPFPPGISFEADYTVKLIDWNGVELKDITNNVFIEEYVGSGQIGIEIVNIGENFYGHPVFMKFNHTLSDVVFYSSPIHINDYEQWCTSYFQYQNENNFQGIVYTQAQKWQSIRLGCYFDKPASETESETYFQVSQNRVSSSRPNIKQFETYAIDKLNPFGFDRLDVLLNHERVYLNGYRVTNKTTPSVGERQGNSNIFDSEFTIQRDFNDFLAYEYQLFTGVQFTQYYPTGNFTLNSLPDELQITANTPIQLIGSGSLRFYDASDNSLLATFTTGTQITDNTIQFTDDLGSILTSNGSYYVLFDDGFIESQIFGLSLDGNLLPENWSINLAVGDFDPADFSDDFFLNI